MTISNRQFTHLNAMGISLWRAKNSMPVEQNASIQQTIISNESDKSVEETPLIQTINANELKQQTIFNDILRALAMNREDIKIIQNSIELGNISWQFSSSSENNADQYHFEHNTLITPNIHLLNQSVDEKRAFWRFLINHNVPALTK